MLTLDMETFAPTPNKEMQLAKNVRIISMMNLGISNNRNAQINCKNCTQCLKYIFPMINLGISDKKSPKKLQKSYAMSEKYLFIDKFGHIQ